MGGDDSHHGVLVSNTNVRAELLTQLESIRCSYLERNGEVWVLTPELRLYRFSLPQEMTGVALSADVEAWVVSQIPDQERA